MRLCASTSLSVRYSLCTGPGKHADPRFVAARRGATSPPTSADGPVGLNLVVAAIVLWNTVYLEETLRASGTVVPDELLQHLSPLAWEHIVLTGEYRWGSDEKRQPGQRQELRPAR
jgi:hypothetical protein